MTNPTPEQIQRKIAELQGWTEVKMSCVGEYNGKRKYRLMGFPPGKRKRGGYIPVPNWPGDRRRSYELRPPRPNDMRYAGETDAIVYYGIRLAMDEFDEEWYPAIVECLLFIWRMGYPWVPCDNCGGSRKLKTPGGKLTKVDCPVCNGAGGEFKPVGE